MFPALAAAPGPGQGRGLRLERGMGFDWSFFISALGLAIVLEGLPYFLWAEKMPKVLLTLATHRHKTLRILGITAIILGVLIIFFGRSLRS